ncbi:protein kinase [Streptomyces sp. NPDC058622]|uniref:protein kinase domain-containing protein n=1 Tax=Streptomyces sp. NPDC058622 TaxID=3346562 RepID=UPI0036478274
MAKAGDADADAVKAAGPVNPASAERAQAKPVPGPGKAGEVKPVLTKAAAAKSGSAKAGAAEPTPANGEAAKPVPVKTEAAEPAPAKAGTGTSGSAKADTAESGSVGVRGAAVEEPEDARPDAAPADVPAAEDVAPVAGAGAAKSVAAVEDAKPVGRVEDAKPVAAVEDAKPVGRVEDAKPVAAVEDAKPVGRVEDAKPVAGSVKGGRKIDDPTPVAEIEQVKPAGKGEDAQAAGRGGSGKAAEGNGKDEGRLLAGRYRLGAVLGKGGMGTVWRAEDEILGRTVAVKELRFTTGVDEDEKRRLITRTLREAKAIARIRSGGAVTVYDVVDEDGRPWIVMELIEGPSLAEFVRENGPLTPRRAAEVGLAVLDVLRAAHRQGILHRDVKPSNVLIAGSSGRVVLTDFGIAQVEGDPSVTSTGMLVGAPSYISPERARGQKPGPPADMWSLGGLLYASVEGVPPYDKGSALATLTAVMTEPVDPPKNAGPLTEVIYGLLAKDPAHRLDDTQARAMLTAVLDAPDPVPVPVASPTAEETRQISLADAKEAADRVAAEKAEKTAEKAAKKEREQRDREQRERARAALKSARKAAVVAAAATAAEAPGPEPKTASKPKASPVAAPLTDVVPRRTIVLAIVAVVVVLAALGSLIAYMVSGDDKDGRKDEGKGGQPTPAASGSATPGGSPQNSPAASPNTGQPGGNTAGEPGQGQDQGQNQGQNQGQGQQTPGADQGQGQGQGSAPGGAGALPAGYITVTEPAFKFSMGMPEGFRRTGTAGEDSGGIWSRDGGFPRIQVDFTPKPGNDAKASWLALAVQTAASSDNYRQIRIDTVDYRGYPTVADWEFEREQKGIKVRVLNRGFKMDAKHGYAIMISCPADQWDAAECTQMRNTAFETFRSLG